MGLREERFLPIVRLGLGNVDANTPKDLKDIHLSENKKLTDLVYESINDVMKEKK